MGVSALCFSLLESLFRRMPDLRVTVFDDGWGVRRSQYASEAGTHPFTCIGARNSWRLHRSESLWNIRVCNWFGGLANPGSRAIRLANAVLDISGGDSFTELYGRRRFQYVTLCKKLTLEQRIPLILLPQTYGPFITRRARQTAERIVRGAAAAWARDPRSFEVLRGLLGNEFDARRHCHGVDVAFALPARRPRGGIPRVLAAEECTRPTVVGINISGLVCSSAAGERFRFKADYRRILQGLIRRLLRETDCRIFLIPHVHGSSGLDESDLTACESVARSMQNTEGRMTVLDQQFDQSELKWLISRCDWFCGTRMHSTIAALSSGVPCAGISYSDKTLGVFESCGQGRCVADPRVLETEAMIDQLWASWEGRDASRTELGLTLPRVRDLLDRQFDLLAEMCRRMPIRSLD
jgi:polysaccharide pyruvyl transferase WcaK-like protein